MLPCHCCLEKEGNMMVHCCHHWDKDKDKSENGSPVIVIIRMRKRVRVKVHHQLSLLR